MLKDYTIVILTKTDRHYHELAKEKVRGWFLDMLEEERKFIKKDFPNDSWYWGSPDDFEPWWERTQLDVYPNGNRHAVFYVMQGDEVVGMCQLDESDYGANDNVKGWFIYGLYIDKAHRGKGIAKILMKRVKAIAKEEGVSLLSLEVYSRNKPAEKLYKDLNFLPVTVRMNCAI